ncbi:hypothetical protein OG590_37605 (plasmid) [Streptomyces goshikiensis]|uniref:hypothetical protein n=1 Tax=Streptomyces goshikiensis TaxID=1942 RepID=UPI003867E8F3|nr:hypothetical protein OG590_37605 [Streptomyces goshikiensis]
MLAPAGQVGVPRKPLPPMIRTVMCATEGRPRQAPGGALVALACDLPPAVLGPMLGLHPITAVQWRSRAATDWTAYLKASTAADDQGQGRGRQRHALNPDRSGQPGAILYPGV